MSDSGIFLFLGYFVFIFLVGIIAGVSVGREVTYKTEAECLAELPRNEFCEMVWVVKKRE